MNWDEVSLSELVSQKSDFVDGPFGSNLKSSEYTEHGVPLIQLKNIKPNKYLPKNLKFVSQKKADSIQRHSYKSGDVVIAKLGAVGTACIIPTGHPDGIVVADVCRFRGDKSKIDYQYLCYFLNSNIGQRRVLELSKGSTRLRTNLTDLKRINIPLPPLETQKQIAAVLEKADQLRKDCQLMEQELNSLAQSVFIDIFGDPVTNSKRWNESLFSNLVTNIQGGQSPKCNTRPAKANEWGVLKLSAVTGGTYKPHENKAILEGTTPNTAIEVKAGDLLFTRKNTYELVGSCAYVSDTTNKLMLPDLIFRFDMPDHLKIYVWGLFNNNEFKQTIKNLASGAAGSMPNISKARLNNLILPTPNAEEVSKYTKLITGIWQQLDLLRQTQDEYEEIFNALMQKAFKGELNSSKATHSSRNRAGKRDKSSSV